MTMTNVYGTITDLRIAAGLTSGNQEFDTKLEAAGDSAARMIDAHCGRPHGFWQDSTVVARSYVVDDRCHLDVDDISTTTGLIVKVDDNDDGTFETTWTIDTHFVVGPFNAAADSRPYEWITPVSGNAFPFSSYGRPSVQVTAKFGWASVPTDVKKAWLIQAVQLYKSDDAPFGGVALGIDGGVLRLGARLHPIAEGLLARVAKPRVG